MTKTKLKPCPVCGMKSRMEALPSIDGWWVTCSDRTRFGVGGRKSCYQSMTCIGTRSQAVAAWNALPRKRKAMRRSN